MSNEKYEILSPSESIKQEHHMILDEYLANGLVGYKAVLKFRPDITDASARVTFSNILKSNQDYIDRKRQELQANTGVMLEQMIREAALHYFSDATNYIGLSTDEIKQLPPEERRAIQKISTKKKTYVNRNKQEVTEETVDVVLVNKNTSGDMLNKLLGNYALDNRQKKSEIDYESLKIDTIKDLMKIAEKNKSNK
jgi:hypothetical protein